MSFYKYWTQQQIDSQISECRYQLEPKESPKGNKQKPKKRGFSTPWLCVFNKINRDRRYFSLKHIVIFKENGQQYLFENSQVKKVARFDPTAITLYSPQIT